MHATVEHQESEWHLWLRRDELDAVMAALRLYGAQDYPGNKHLTTIAKGMRQQLLGLTAA